MACEACSVKFSLFKRKKQCMDCLRHFCSECVIKRVDKMLSCDSCSMLSRRPLIRSQIAQMRSRDLRHYLLAKKVCVEGCVEKQDLVSLLMSFANETSDRSDTEYDGNTRSGNRSQESTGGSPSRQFENSPADIEHEESANVASDRAADQAVDRTSDLRADIARVGDVEIQEVSASESSPNDGPEPLITEQDEISSISETSDVQRSETLTEIPVWSGLVKLSDINDLSELECLSVKQLKNLLSTNRVDYRGCIERCELLDRAFRLWKGHKQSRTDVERLDEEDLCKICWDAPIECVILECGHMVCCINCGKQMSECPICKQYVVRVVRFFKA